MRPFALYILQKKKKKISRCFLWGWEIGAVHCWLGHLRDAHTLLLRVQLV